MEKTSGTKEELLEEISELKKKIKKLEKSAAQHKQMEDALRESELKYRSVVECSSDAIFCVDEKGQYQFTNSLFASTFGKPPEYFIGKTFWDIYPKEHADKRYEVTKRVFATGRSESLEVEVPLRDKTLYFYATADPIKDETGKVILNLTHGVNITERKLAEAQSKATLAALRDSEASLAEAQRIARIGSWDWDMISNTVKWSKEMYRVFGINPDAFDGKPESLLKVIHPDDAELFTKSMKSNLKKGNPTSLEFRVIHKSGSCHYIFAAGRVEFNETGRPIRNIGTAQDITERKQAEDALRENAEQHQAILRTAMDGIWRIDMQGHLLEVNDAYCRMSGYSEHELLTMQIVDLEVHENAIDIAAHLQKIITYGKDGFQSRHRRKDGSIFDVEISVQYQPIDGGWMVAFLRDITERVKVAEEKENIKNRLFQSQKMEAIGTLAGGIADDFNNILSVIIGYTELARDRNQKETKEQYLREVLMGAERAKNLVKQILTFSRQDDREKKPLNINRLLKEAVKFLRTSIPETIEIDQHIAGEECDIMADSNQMHQVIMNLCTNASHAMKEAGGILKIELSQEAISHHPDLKPGHYAKLTVSDTGHGIDPAIVQRIFDPFFTTKSKDEGTGLGLSVVYGIVKSHGGVINVYSEQGKGATFNIYLPVIGINHGTSIQLVHRIEH